MSCKGTTCQYGLIDTFDLSEKLHERFYVGYHGVELPHKFKIAVGGCPNMCVKPDLNDLGIVGQRVPQVESREVPRVQGLPGREGMPDGRRADRAGRQGHDRRLWRATTVDAAWARARSGP